MDYQICIYRLKYKMQIYKTLNNDKQKKRTNEEIFENRKKNIQKEFCIKLRLLMNIFKSGFDTIKDKNII